MKKMIMTLVSIMIIGSSTCMAKANVSPNRKAIKPTTTTVTTTTEIVKPNGTKVITTTTTKTVTATTKSVKTVQPKKTTICQKKHGHGTSNDCTKQVKVTPKR